MKKLLFMVCTAALFSVAGVVQAQQQDEKPKQSNQYRNTPQNQQTDTTASDQEGMQGDQNMPQESEVEVVESKEGPNSEVVYRYQGELFYVDREEKKLVKADESELKDATHKTIVKDNTATIQENSARRNRNNQ
jgi:hypothetical protein